MEKGIEDYNNSQLPIDQEICQTLSQKISALLWDAIGKIWHKHPVWFLNGNPIVGYSKQKRGVRLMFWSGSSFEDNALNVRGPKFKDASIFYNSVQEINIKQLENWLNKAKHIQWDYKNIVKRKGKLELLSNGSGK